MVVLPSEDRVTVGGRQRTEDEGRQGCRSFTIFYLLFSILVLLNTSCARNTSEVVIYTAQDEAYADLIFKDFEKKTGIKVKAVFDSEAVKTVAMANRLLAEKSHPQCDVFWANEELRTRQLATKGIFRETNGWAAMGYRTRRLVVNTNLLPLAKAPKTFSEATNEIWRGKVALAYPLFGTTAAHFLTLRQKWGDAAWQGWCRALAANKPLLVDGNSVVVKMVGSGEAWFGFSDADDIAEGRINGYPIVELPTVDETLFIPNTVGVVRGAPHPEAAQKLFEYLQSHEVLERLVQVKALESVELPKAGTGLPVNWDALVRELDSTTVSLKEVFLR
ncbi:MAG: Extracellular solute-binding protein family 1 [Pedosphaera sp.]|nr:Extracellular solute-binding protein family 1 [Pedosphaera sp.]